MQPVKITVKDGIGREVNPYQQMIRGEDGEELSQDYYEFDISNNSYPCPELANTKPGETVGAKLINQFLDGKKFEDCNREISFDYYQGTTTRQIYRLVPKKEKGAVHELKTVQPFFTQIKQGKKTFELRKNDRGFKIGDTLLLKEYTIPDHDFMGGDEYSGKSISVKVIGMLENYRGLEEGYCIMSIQVL